MIGKPTHPFTTPLEIYRKTELPQQVQGVETSGCKIGRKMNLRPRKRQPFSGFTTAEVEKMEHLLKEYKEQYLDDEFYKKLARVFSRSNGRAGKPAVKWTEVQIWFQNKQQNCLTKETSSNAPKKSPAVSDVCTFNEVSGHPQAPKVTRVLRSSGPQRRVDVGDTVVGISSNKNSQNHCAQERKIVLEISAGEKDQDLSKMEFEARSSTDGAWYDVEKFLLHRCLRSGEIEVCVRYVGFGAEEDEWVNVRNDVRKRSVPLEHSECQKVKVGDLVVCFQERQDQARYYDAHVIEIERRLHDIRGCRCIFLIRYEHDSKEERVRLRRLCCRPDMLAEPERI
ncbi:Protein SAWADEE HOMEODOMAIN-like protein 1 [Forsythia ovata]|uniref:Protein SAWADEE HOMEODOMAIN-like protein 1 n=2 Tax=Forsythia ovata TaxID=205694 RepID=A0ABD1W5R1_9LAMI